eukprot:c8602_g1_i1.p1 GENE.c8602_g1_i1~~c8602_g1_i1.p1  ORF type:complete len:363 (+),score=90.26 c8602_g1_i1:50-1090(+)
MSSFEQLLPQTEQEHVKIAVIGGGTFGTAMSLIASRKGHRVVIVVRDAAQAESINTKHINSSFFSEYTLPDSISATTNVKEACQGCAFIIHAIPAQMTPDWMEANKNNIPDNTIICCTSKGLYVKTKQLLHEPILKALGRDQPLCFLSGPSFAKEILDNQPTAVVVAARFLPHAVTVQRALSTLFFRVYTSQDIVGVQLGGALKNPLAIGAGVIQARGFGTNTLTAYVTRSALELQKLCVAMGGQPETVSGLSGIGDLMLTAFGELSRNRRCGQRLAKGEKLEEICRDYTVEGVPTAEVAVVFADMCALELPIFRTIHGILSGHVRIEDAHEQLMGRPLKQEKTVD